MAEDSPETWQTQAHAVGLLNEVSRYISAAIDSGRPMDHYLRAYPSWARGVFAPHMHWSSTTSNDTELIDQTSIDVLRALGDIMQSIGLVVSLDADTTRSSLEALEELLECLAAPEVQLSDVERQYVYELISSLRRVFEESSVLGSVDLLRRVHELLGVMTMLAETLSKHKETKTLAKRILTSVRKVVPYARFGAKVVAGTLGAAADMQQITGG